MSDLPEYLQKNYLKSSKSLLNVIFMNVCNNGDSASVSWILSHDDLSYKLDNINASLNLACINGHLNIVKQLSKVDKFRYIDLYDSIECALENNHEDIIQYLFNSRENILYPLLKKAFPENNNKLIKRIFRDLSVSELNQNNPRLNEGIIMIDRCAFELKKILNASINNNNFELVKFFLNDKSIPNLALKSVNFIGLINPMRNQGTVSADLSFYLLKYSEEKQIEIPHGIMVKLFFKACEDSHFPMAKYLLNHPDLSKRVNINTDEDTGLLKACHKGNLEMVKYLLTSPELEKHANITAQDNSPLLYAAQEGHLELVEYLTSSTDLKENANIHAQDEFALCLAFKGDHKEIVQFLLTSPKLKTHLDIFKNFHEIKEQHLANVDYGISENYEMKTLAYLVHEYEPFTSNQIFVSDIEEMLESNYKLKLIYNALQLSQELSQNSDYKINSKKIKL